MKLESMKKLLKNDKAQIGTLYMVFFAAIIVLAIIIVFTFIPGIGTTVQQSTPTLPPYCTNKTFTQAACEASRVAGGEWNASDTNNTNAAALQKASGSSIWTSTSGILLVAVIIGIVVIILAALFGIFRSPKGGEPGAPGGGM